MSHLIPGGFLTMRQAADQLAIAMYSGEPDRPVATQQRELGNDVADGAAVVDAIGRIWAAVDRGKL